MEGIHNGTTKVNKPIVAAVHDNVVITLTKPIKSTVTDTLSRGDEAEWEEQYRKPMARPPPVEVNDVQLDLDLWKRTAACWCSSERFKWSLLLKFSLRQK
jgi:hypothetical protein